ncbi:tetrahydrofolate dehydrogenase/cyclohydrolase catalytic domain-containing protein [Mesorhizobium sp. M0309]|uniref:tetrahydrofolate dehydrogenase/cyclohydrolase catalytic domain-containing protein n=1 Tax=Mesorhizobium sp. M0309 TaxID=2956933 RepID=UPI00333A35C1
MSGTSACSSLIEQLNSDPENHGILVQLPLPKHLNAELVINAMDPAKDVDGFAFRMSGFSTRDKMRWCHVLLGCLMLLRGHLGHLSGLEAVVVGRSNIVGTDGATPAQRQLHREAPSIRSGRHRSTGWAERNLCHR